MDLVQIIRNKGWKPLLEGTIAKIERNNYTFVAYIGELAIEFDQTPPGTIDVEYLLRCGTVLMRDLKWTEVELLAHIHSLSCAKMNLTSLPSLPNCEHLDCSCNPLTSIPCLPRCKILNCGGCSQLNKLPKLPSIISLCCSGTSVTTLPPLSNCIFLHATGCHLTRLPPLPKCKKLIVFQNPLKTIPPMPHCEVLDVEDDPLPFESGKVKHWKPYWVQETMFDFIYGGLWMKLWWAFLHHLKKDLHLELKYSPDLPFYKKEWILDHPTG